MQMVGYLSDIDDLASLLFLQRHVPETYVTTVWHYNDVVSSHYDLDYLRFLLV